eukprot:2012883-Pleurochrysis_carterae.AAC.1
MALPLPPTLAKAARRAPEHGRARSRLLRARPLVIPPRLTPFLPCNAICLAASQSCFPVFEDGRFGDRRDPCHPRTLRTHPPCTHLRPAARVPSRGRRRRLSLAPPPSSRASPRPS